MQSDQTFQEGTELKPNYHKAANNLGAAYLLGRWDDPLRCIKPKGNIMYVTPGHGHNPGWVQAHRGDTTAARHFRMAISLAFGCVAQNNLGLVMMQQRNTRRATKFLSEQ